MQSWLIVALSSSARVGGTAEQLVLRRWMGLAGTCWVRRVTRGRAGPRVRTPDRPAKATVRRFAGQI
eukprot:6251088-Alexandrium_andersonii.AAC.1